MEIKKGIAVSPGIAIATPMIIDSEDFRIPRRSIMPSQKLSEVRRVRNAFKFAIEEVTELASVPDVQESQIKDIFAVHLRFLRDRSLRKKITDIVQTELLTAEYAVSMVLREIADHFSNVEDAYISERATDIYDLERRLLKHLVGEKREDVSHLDKEVVVVAHDLTPMQTVGFDKKYVKGFATDAGGRTSHTAIVARSLGIPAVVALEDLTGSIKVGQIVIIDGNRGVVIIEPDEKTIEQYQEYAKEFDRFEHELDSIKKLKPVTRDGIEINLFGNIEFPDESSLIVEKGGSGVGLYRTEFLYLYSGTEPTEDDHYQAYVKTMAICEDRPVVIRTVDLGADKHTQNRRYAKEPNPSLGLRSIRYCLQNILMFKTQLRAILRASAIGDIRIMFPLITNLQELRQSKMILRDVMDDLAEDGMKYDANIKIGIMIETPSAALTAGVLAQEVDFFSIGTNDLVQYTLAVDRGNELVSTMYSAGDPAVLMLLKNVIIAAHKAKIGLSICGEMASEPEYVMLLLGLGVKTLSIAPSMIPEIKQIIRSVTIDTCNSVARKVMTMDSRRQVTNYLRDAAMNVFPQVY